MITTREPRFVTIQDMRAELAKSIYLLSTPDQATFRSRFPAGIPDEQVDAAIQHAKSFARKVRQ